VKFPHPCTGMAFLWFMPMFMTLPSMHGFVANYNQSGQHLQWFKPETSRFVSANVIHLETRTIRYYLDEAAYSETNRKQELDAIRVAFDQWQSVPNTDLHFEDAGFIEGEPVINLFDNTNMIYWEKESFLVNGGLDDIRGFLGLTYRAYFEDANMVEADIVFNGIERGWTTDFANPPFGAAFTESIAMHEIGHLIGMEHSSIGSSTMMWRDRYGPNNQLDLSMDDVAFVQAYYPAKGLSSQLGSLRGKVQLNGLGLPGAVILLEDTDGNLIQGTISEPANDAWEDGFYQMKAIPPGAYLLRVCPLDPPTAPNPWLIKGANIDFIKHGAGETAFLPSEPIEVDIAKGLSIEQDLSVSPGTPTLRIASIQPTASDIRLLTNEQSAAQVRQGDQNIWIGFYGENLGATEEPVHVGIRGSGIRTGITQFREKQFGTLDAWILQVSVADDAPLGLRSFYIRRGDEIAYANGFIDVRPSVPDFNQDGLNDDFQRTFYTRWTSPSAKPLADSDGDQYSNAEEYEAGSIPTLATSNPVTVLPPFSLLDVSLDEQGAWIRFESKPGMRYQLHGRKDVNGDAWSARGEAITATEGITILHDPSNNDLQSFYRVEVLPR